MPDAHPNHEQPSRLPPVPTQMFYAVRGTDRISGVEVQTVIKAPTEEAARQLADQKSLTANDIELMHPLNGAQAWKEALADPNDRFNHPGDVNTSAAVFSTDGQAAPQSVRSTPQIASPTSRPEPPAPPTADPTADPMVAPESQAQRPLGFDTPATSDTTTSKRPAFSGSVGAGMLLTCLGGLAYFVVLREPPQGAMADVYSASPNRSTVITTTPSQSAGPTDVDELIASSKKSVSPPILPRAQRGPGQTAYRAAHKQPTRPPAALAQRAPRAKPVEPLVLTAIVGRNKSHRGQAQINGKLIKIGESVGSHRLIRILDDSVVLKCDKGHLIGLGFTTPDTAPSE